MGLADWAEWSYGGIDLYDSSSRGLSMRYEVMDVTQMPHTGSQFDLIVDSYCINHIVFDEERRKVFGSVKARLKSAGFFLISSSVCEPSRHAVMHLL